MANAERASLQIEVARLRALFSAFFEHASHGSGGACSFCEAVDLEIMEGGKGDNSPELLNEIFYALTQALSDVTKRLQRPAVPQEAGELEYELELHPDKPLIARTSTEALGKFLDGLCAGGDAWVYLLEKGSGGYTGSYVMTSARAHLAHFD